MENQIETEKGLGHVVVEVENSAGPHLGEAEFLTIEGEVLVRLITYNGEVRLINTRYVRVIRVLSENDYQILVDRYDDMSVRNGGEPKVRPWHSR